MPSPFDPESRVFKTFESPGLPSMILISPSGAILQYHEGLFPEMHETLKKELQPAK